MKAKTKEEIIKLVNDYESKLKEQGVIKLVFKLGKEQELNQDSLKDFIIDFMKINYDEMWLGHKHSLNSTTDANGNWQCRHKAARSIGDIYRICLAHYTKSTTLLEVMETIYSIIREDQPIVEGGNYTYHMYTSVCSTIHRRVFWLNAKINDHGIDENSISYNQSAEKSHDEFIVIAEDYATLFKESFEEKQKDKELAAIIKELESPAELAI